MVTTTIIPRVGDTVTDRRLTAISGEPVPIPDPERLVHLQFRRFAGCPVCSLHLRSFARRYHQITAAGVREVVVFHSTADDLRAHAGDLPFALIADPERRLYVEFGVESSYRALLDPRSWPGIMRGILHSSWEAICRRRPLPSAKPHGGRFGLPADLLIASDGRVVASKYGTHADDQWSVAELIHHARMALQAEVSGLTRTM